MSLRTYLQHMYIVHIRILAENAIVRTPNHQHDDPILNQGANFVLTELRQLYTTYPETQEYIQKMARILNACAKTPEALKLSLHNNGMDILSWLEDETKAPSEDYLLRCVFGVK